MLQSYLREMSSVVSHLVQMEEDMDSTRWGSSYPGRQGYFGGVRLTGCQADPGSRKGGREWPEPPSASPRVHVGPALSATPFGRKKEDWKGLLALVALLRLLALNVF